MSVICLSGGHTPERAAIGALVDAALPKPFDLDELPGLVAHRAHRTHAN